MSDFDAVLEADPLQLETLNFRGAVWMRMGKFPSAMADFNAVLGIDPEYAHGYANRGIAHRNQGRGQQALADFDTALRLDPTLWHVWQNRAAIIQETDPAGTVHALQQAYIHCPHAETRAQFAEWIRGYGAVVPDRDD